MAVTWRDQLGDWGYSVSANLTTIKNEVKSLVQEGYSIIAGDKQQSYTMAGYPIGYFYGYKVAGVYQSQADIDASPKNTLATVTPGDLKFADVNGDGEITQMCIRDRVGASASLPAPTLISMESHWRME